jgi:hypothetical protein
MVNYFVENGSLRIPHSNVAKCAPLEWATFTGLALAL